MFGRETHKEGFKISVNTTGKLNIPSFCKASVCRGLNSSGCGPWCSSLWSSALLSVDSLHEKWLLNPNMRPKHAPTSLPVLGYFSIPGYKVPGLIHPCVWNSIPGQKGNACLCYQWPETEYEPPSPETKLGVWPQKISEKSFSNAVHSSLLQSVQGEASTATARQVGLSLLQSISTLCFQDEKVFMCSF